MKYKLIKQILNIPDEKRVVLRQSSFNQGSGLFKKFNNKPLEYIYWNDINELVDRLWKLVAEYQAGNKSHRNEILSIISELEEEGIVKSKRALRF